jgi:hypothetical protein
VFLSILRNLVSGKPKICLSKFSSSPEIQLLTLTLK